MINNNQFETFNHKLYYVTSQQDNTVFVAINPRLVFSEYVSWFDMIRERMIKVSKFIKTDDNLIIFEGMRINSESILYTLVPMSLDIYEEKVRPRLQNTIVFNTEQEMIDAFLDRREFLT